MRLGPIPAASLRGFAQDRAHARHGASLHALTLVHPPRGRPTQATIAFDDHPSARRFSSQVDTVTVDSMFAWLPRTNLFEPPQLVKQ